MPDANKESTLTALCGAAFGAAGQRCMALSTAIFVGEAREWIPELVEKARKLKVNAGSSIIKHDIDSVDVNKVRSKDLSNLRLILALES